MVKTSGTPENTYHCRQNHLYGKIMLFCGFRNLIKFDKRGHVQQYKCNECGRRFSGGERRDKAQVITDYIEGKPCRNA